MLDAKLKPWLIEINQMPSFGTDSTLDYKIKRGLITDCFKTLNLSMARKNRYKIEKKNKFNERMMQKPVHSIKTNPKRTNKKLQEDVTPPRGQEPNNDNNQKMTEFTNIESQIEKEQKSIRRADEERQQKQNQKNAAREEKEKLRIQKQLRREINEAKVCNDLQLIYPIISYEHDNLIQRTFKKEE